VLTSGLADAAKCGGDRECQCGDRVVESYRLPRDLGPCPELGLEIAAAIELDGGGHTITGKGKGVGLKLGPAANGSQVRDLRLTRFHLGVRLQETSGTRLEGIEAFRNGDRKKHEGYGIDIAQRASKNVLSRVRVHDNADEGIHVGAFAHANRIVDSEIWGNYRENVYFLANRSSRLERSRMRSPGQGAANVYIKFSRDSVLDGNTIEGGTVQIRGASEGTQLLNNTLADASIVLQSQKDRRFGSGQPSHLTIRGGKIAIDGSCIRVEAGSDIEIEATQLQCRDAVAIEGKSDVALRDVENESIRCTGPGQVSRLRSVDVRFVDAKGRPISGAKLVTRAGRTLGVAEPDGRYRGRVEVARLECPGGDWKPVAEVVAAADGREQVVAVSQLRGNVKIAAPPAKPAAKR
jgi:hypothetical protein